MRDTRFRFEFAADVDVAEAQGTLCLSLLAAEGLQQRQAERALPVAVGGRGPARRCQGPNRRGVLG